MTLAVVRVRGTSNIKPDIRYTMELLRLWRPNHCVVIPGSENYLGMLRKVKDYVTWGEIDAETLEQLLISRGRLEGDHPLSDEYVKTNTTFKNIKGLTEALISGKVHVNDVPGFKPVFRLNPPTHGGYEGIKRAFRAGGALGDRGDEINELLRRMV